MEAVMNSIDEVLNNALTPEQKDAVVDPAPNILCLACAGSGKSRTLAYRIAYLIHQGNPPQSIVAFTFTEKAAESIKRRVAEALHSFGLSTNLVGAMYIGTIHSYCQHILGVINAKYRQYDVLDENQFKLFILSRYSDLEINKIRQERNARMFQTINEVANAWNTANDECISFDDIEKEDPTLGKILKNVEERLNREHFLDFSLMIKLAVLELEKQSPAIDLALIEFNHLFVDEYQDINPMQERLIKSLRSKGESLLVVGDDDQAIYAWRGANVDNILSFDKRYDNCAIHKLNTNFRSSKIIVDTANNFVQQELSTARYDKTPTSFSDGNVGDFKSVWLDTRQDEAEWVANRIEVLLGTEYVEKYDEDGKPIDSRGLTPADFAILFRGIKGSYGAPPKHLEFTQALKDKGILYSLESEGGIFERPYAVAIRDIMEILREPNPTRTQLYDLYHNSIKSYFPLADFNELCKVVSDWNTAIYSPIGIGSRRRVYLQEFFHELMVALHVPDSNFNDIILRDLGIFSGIISDVEKVYVSVDSSFRYGQILNFLQNVAESGYDTSTLDIIAKPDTVTVSTIHKMKGLEFPVVFIVDVIKGRFPHNQSNYNGWLPGNLISTATARGAYCTRRPDEARLFYTAMTRAERFLYISGSAQQPNNKKPSTPSPFKKRIDDLGIPNDSNTLPVSLKKVAPRRRIDETILPTSYSDIKEYLACPMRYKLKKLFSFNPSVPELFGYGLTTHTIIERLHQLYKDQAPNISDVTRIVAETFHLKHIFPSNDPINHPGAYERAFKSAESAVQKYVINFSDDFTHLREDEVRFEISVGKALISGSIDLLMKKDATGNIVDAHVIDFKSMEEPPITSQNDWIDLAVQVQLYAYAAEEVLDEKAKTGSVHLLRDSNRVDIPIQDSDINASIDNIEWAVERIINEDFPMRPCQGKCNTCDVRRICARKKENFATTAIPSPISLPKALPPTLPKAFSECD